MTYKHLNQSARDRIEVLLEAGHTQTEIASVLKVNRSTISREIQNRKRMDDRYDADLADHKAYVKRLYSKYQGMKIEGKDKLPKVMIPNLVSIHAIPREMIQCEGDTFVSPKRYQTTASVAVVVEKISKLILAKKISNLKPRV